MNKQYFFLLYTKIKKKKAKFYNLISLMRVIVIWFESTIEMHE